MHTYTCIKTHKRKCVCVCRILFIVQLLEQSSEEKYLYIYKYSIPTKEKKMKMVKGKIQLCTICFFLMVWCAVFCTVLVSEACLRISQYLSFWKYSVTLNAFVMLNNCNNNDRFIFIFFHTVVCTRNAFERFFSTLLQTCNNILFVNCIVNMFVF